MAVYYLKFGKKQHGMSIRIEEYIIDSFLGYESLYLKQFWFELKEKLQVPDNYDLRLCGFYEPFQKRRIPYGTMVCNTDADRIVYEIALSDNIKSSVVEFGDPKHLQTIWLNAGDVFGYNRVKRHCQPDNDQKNQRWMLYFLLVNKSELIDHVVIENEYEYPTTINEISMLGDIGADSNRIKTICQHTDKLYQDTQYRCNFLDFIPDHHYNNYSNLCCGTRGISSDMFKSLIENMAAESKVEVTALDDTIRHIIGQCTVNAVTLFGAEHLHGNVVEFVQASNDEARKIRNNHGVVNFIVVPRDYIPVAQEQKSRLILDGKRFRVIGGRDETNLYVFFGGLKNVIEDDLFNVISFVARTPSIQRLSDVVLTEND